MQSLCKYMRYEEFSAQARISKGECCFIKILHPFCERQKSRHDGLSGGLGVPEDPFTATASKDRSSHAACSLCAAALHTDVFRPPTDVTCVRPAVATKIQSLSLSVTGNTNTIAGSSNLNSSNRNSTTRRQQCSLGQQAQA